MLLNVEKYADLLRKIADERGNKILRASKYWVEQILHILRQNSTVNEMRKIYEKDNRDKKKRVTANWI